MDLLLVFISINFSHGSDLLSGQEYTDLVAEEVEEVRVEDSGVFWIELLDELVKGVEVLDSLTEHLLLDLVVDLVGFVFPVHWGWWGFRGVYVFVIRLSY